MILEHRDQRHFRLTHSVYANTVKAGTMDRVPQHPKKLLERLKMTVVNHLREASATAGS